MEYGAGACNRLFTIARKMDQLYSEYDANNLKQYSSTLQRNQYRKRRQRIHRNINRKRHKLKDLKKDMHEKVSKDMLKMYDHILIPSFQVSGMVNSSLNRRICKKTVRQMLSLGHYQFRQRLIQKAEETKGKYVHVVTEPYTSKACSGCGRLNYSLGSSKVFNCSACGLRMDRDWNG